MSLSELDCVKHLNDDWIPVTYYYDLLDDNEVLALLSESRRLKHKGDKVAILLLDTRKKAQEVEKGTEVSTTLSLYGAIYRYKRDEKDTAQTSK